MVFVCVTVSQCKHTSSNQKSPLKILAKYFYQLLFFKVAIFKGYSKLKYKALQLYTLNYYDFCVLILKGHFSVINSSFYFEG